MEDFTASSFIQRSQGYHAGEGKLLFSSLGQGDINRFQNTDEESNFENHICSDFMVKTIMFIIRDRQNACARCNVVSTDKWYGAFGFKSDHVDENYRREGEESKKRFKVRAGRSMSILNMLEEIAKTQLICTHCHQITTFTNDATRIRT